MRTSQNAAGWLMSNRRRPSDDHRPAAGQGCGTAMRRSRRALVRYRPSPTWRARRCDAGPQAFAVSVAAQQGDLRPSRRRPARIAPPDHALTVEAFGGTLYMRSGAPPIGVLRGVKREAGVLADQSGAAPATVGESRRVRKPLRACVGRRLDRSDPLTSPYTDLQRGGTCCGGRHRCGRVHPGATGTATRT